jgi:hypothetical protein
MVQPTASKMTLVGLTHFFSGKVSGQPIQLEAAGFVYTVLLDR